MKKCSKCHEYKEHDKFSKNKNKKDGLSSRCKDCAKIYYDNNREKILNKQREDYLNNRDLILENSKSYYLKNIEIISNRHKNYYENNKYEISNKKKEYNIENKEEISNQKKEYYKENKYIIKEKRRKYMNFKRNSDCIFKLKCNIRNLIHNSFRGYLKESKTENILGCSFEDFRIYLESKFEYWMSLDNYGLYNGELNYGWDIDHIIPLSSAETEEDVIRLNHYSNLQPLCSKVNRDIKRDIIKKDLN